MNKRLFPMYLSAIILAVFTILFVIRGNYEFLIYAFTLFPLIWIVTKTDKMFNYSGLAKWGFAVWMFLHVIGGSIKFHGVRLYDTIFFNLVADPYNILRYDQVIHTFCYFVFTLFVYAVVVSMSKPKTNKLQIMIIAFIGSMGVSALNEIIEFGAVAFLGSEGVGGYFNNALDLVFNAIGAVAALLFMHKKGG
jgi:putative membrane protein